MKEPVIHSHITDELPEDHPLAYKQLYCDKCPDTLVHAFNNECMQTWVETRSGNYCLKCFSEIGGTVLSEHLSLP